MAYGDDEVRALGDAMSRLSDSMRPVVDNLTARRFDQRLNGVTARRKLAEQRYLAEMRRLDEEQERLERRVAVAEKLGGARDVHEDGTVLWIRVYFTASPETMYTYVLLRADGMWYCTESKWTVRSWTGVIEWLISNGRNVSEVRTMRVDEVLYEATS